MLAVLEAPSGMYVDPLKDLDVGHPQKTRLQLQGKGRDPKAKRRRRPTVLRKPRVCRQVGRKH